MIVDLLVPKKKETKPIENFRYRKEIIQNTKLLHIPKTSYYCQVTLNDNGVCSSRKVKEQYDSYEITDDDWKSIFRYAVEKGILWSIDFDCDDEQLCELYEEVDNVLNYLKYKKGTTLTEQEIENLTRDFSIIVEEHGISVNKFHFILKKDKKSTFYYLTRYTLIYILEDISIPNIIENVTSIYRQLSIFKDIEFDWEEKRLKEKEKKAHPLSHSAEILQYLFSSINSKDVINQLGITEKEYLQCRNEMIEHAEMYRGKLVYKEEGEK